MANVEQSTLGPQFSESVYNTMRNIHDKEDNNYIQQMREQIKVAEEFILSFMRNENHKKLMRQLLDRNHKAIAEGRKGKETTRPMTEKEKLETLLSVYRQTVVKQIEKYLEHDFYEAMHLMKDPNEK